MCINRGDGRLKRYAFLCNISDGRLRLRPSGLEQCFGDSQEGSEYSVLWTVKKAVSYDDAGQSLQQLKRVRFVELLLNRVHQGCWLSLCGVKQQF